MSLDMNGFLENVKRAALEAVNAAKPFAFVLGKVTSVSPLKVQVDQKLELTAAPVSYTHLDVYKRQGAINALIQEAYQAGVFQFAPPRRQAYDRA